MLERGITVYLIQNGQFKVESTLKAPNLAYSDWLDAATTTKDQAPGAQQHT